MEAEVVNQSPDNISNYFNDVVKPAGDFDSEAEFRKFVSNPVKAKSYFEDVVKERGDFDSDTEFVEFIGLKPTELPGKQSPDFTMGNLVGRKPSAQNPSSASQSKSAGSPSESQPPLAVAGRSTLPANLDGKQLKQYAKQIGVPEVGLPDDAQLDKLAERLRGKSFFAAQLEFGLEKERQIRSSNAAKKEAGENRDARGLYEARKQVRAAYSGVQTALVYEQEQMKPAVEEASAILGQYETQLGELKSVFENESLPPEERNAAGQQFNELRQEASAKYAEMSPIIDKYNENQKALGSLGRLLPTGDEGVRIRNSLDAYIKMNPYSALNNSAVQGFSNAILPSFTRTAAFVFDNFSPGDDYSDAIAAKLFDIADQITITPSEKAEVSVFDEMNSENLQYTIGNILGYMVPAMLTGGAMATTQQASTAARVVTGSQVYGNFYKEALDAGLTKNEATLFSAVPTLVTAYFGDRGVEAMLAQLGKSTTKQLIKEAVRDMSGKSASEILELSSKFARGFMVGALKEGTQEGVEQLSEMVSKDIANQTLDANFEGDYSIDGYLKGVGEATALGAAVGAPLGGVSGITSRQNIIQSATQAATDPDAEKIYLDTIESMLAQGELGQADYDKALSLFQEAKKAVESIPPTVQDEVDKEEATNLIIEQQTLNQQIEVTNPAMVAPLEARLAEVNTRLAAIADGKPREVVSEVKPKEEAAPLTNQVSNTEQEKGEFSIQGTFDGLRQVLGSPENMIPDVQRGGGKREFSESSQNGKKIFTLRVPQLDNVGRAGYLAVSLVLPETTNKTIDDVKGDLEKKLAEAQAAVNLSRDRGFPLETTFGKVSSEYVEVAPAQTTETATATEGTTSQQAPTTETQTQSQQAPTQAKTQPEIILSGAAGGFKGVSKNAFDLRSLNGIRQAISDNISFAKVFEYKGKKYVGVGLVLSMDSQRGDPNGRNNYSFAVAELNENTPSNIVETLENSARENFKNVYNDFSSNDSVSPIEEVDAELNNLTQTPQQDATKTGNQQQSDQQKREGAAGSQQGQQADRNNQEENVAPSQAETGGSNQPSESGAQQESQEVNQVAQKSQIAPKNFRDLFKVNRELFGLDRVKSLASSIAMDRMIGAMAKRAGTSKSEMYGRLKFEKVTEQDLPQGVKMQVDAWHGSPYQFDKFTTEKIGTGEGAQAFGWGLYFTDLEGIARNYAKTLSKANTSKFDFEGKDVPSVINTILQYLERSGFDINTDNVKDVLTSYINEEIEEEPDNLEELQNALDFVNNTNITKAKNNRNLYKVSLQKGKNPDQYTWLEYDRPVEDKTINNIAESLYSILGDSTMLGDWDTIFKKNNIGATSPYLKNSKTGEEVEADASNKRFKEIQIEALKKRLLEGTFKQGKKDGNSVYKELSSLLGGPKNASLFLLKNGIDGIKYPAESVSRGATSDNARGFNYVVFDENAVSIEDVIKFQKDANKARGAAMVGMDGQAVVYALSDPNVSTPLHEMAHVFEHYLTDAERNSVQDFAGTKEWTIETSEKFARGFEKYLADGKAPSTAIEKVFAKFKEWLIDIYNGIVGSEIDIELNDAMRDIYSQMLGEDIINKPKEVATIPPATDQGGQAPPSGGSGGTGRRTPPSDKQKENNRTRVRDIMERWARNREIKFQDFQGAEAIRRLGTYTQVSMEQANTIADALIDDVGIEAAMDISMDPEFAGNVRTAILGRNLNQLADKARKKNTPENVTNLANAIIEFSIYGTNLGQALSQIRDVIESNPELFFADSLRTKSSSINNPTMGDPTTTGTRAQVGLSARGAVEAAREAAFDEIMSALTNPLTPEQAMRQALEKAFELSGNDRAVLADMLKDLRDRGLLASVENKDIAVNAVYDALNGLNNQLENPLADADIRQIAETLIDAYEKIAAEKIKTEIGKILNTEAKRKGMRNEDKAIRALLYGALDDADYLEKWSMMFGGVSSAAFTAEEKAELKRLSELYAETKNQQGANALATNSVNAQFKAYMNKAFIRQMAPGRKFRNRFIQAANLISGLRYNWILTAPTTLARVFSGTVESATTELASSMLADIVQGRPVAAKDAITKSFGNKQVVFTNAAGQQQAVELNRVLDNIYASIRGMPKMKAGGGQVFTEIEQLIRTNPKRATRVLLRALGVSAGRSMTAIDQLIIPITQYYTKSQVMYEIVKELYVQAGQDVKDPLVRAKITNDLESIMNGTPDQWGDALAQAQKDIIMGDLYKRSGLTAFPTTDPRKTKGVLSVEAKVYSEWLQRAYEIMDSKEAERLNKIATDGGWIGTMNPTQEMMALNAYLNAVTNSLTYTGLPRGTAGYLTDVVAKLAEKAPALQWAGVLPLFVNASGNFVAWTITNTPGINAIQLAKYYATGSRGAYRLKGSSEKELSQPGAVKVDQGKMAARVAITNAIFVATLLVNKALRGDDDDEREKFQESIMNGTYTGYTPVRLHPAFEAKGYKGGWFYYKGKPIFAYKDGGLAPFFNAVAFIDNYDKFTPPGVVGFGKDVQPFREESPEFAEAIFEYSLLVGRTAMDQSMLVEFSKTIDDVNKILVAEEGTYSDKAVKSMTNAFAKFTRSYIPYSRLQENIKSEVRENKPDPITFNQRVAAGTFLEQWAESSEKVDWFGRPIKSQMNYVSPFNLVSGAMNLATEDNKAIKDDALIDLFLSKNYAPTNYPQQFVPLMVDQEDLHSKDLVSFADRLEQSPEFKAGRIGQIKLRAENVDASGKPLYKKVPFTLFLEPDEVIKVNTQKSVIAGDFIQRNIGKFRNLPDDVFADIMNQAYNIANKVAISKQIPQVLKYMPDYETSIENSIRNFEAKYPNVGFEWPSKYK